MFFNAYLEVNETIVQQSHRNRLVEITRHVIRNRLPVWLTFLDPKTSQARRDPGRECGLVTKKKKKIVTLNVAECTPRSTKSKGVQGHRSDK